MGDTSVEERVQSVFRRVFDREDLQLRREMTAFDIEGWDSMSNVKLILGVQQDFKIKFQASEVTRMKNVGDFIDAVQAKVQARTP